MPMLCNKNESQTISMVMEAMNLYSTSELN